MTIEWNNRQERINREVAFAVTFQLCSVGIKNMLIAGVPLLYQMNNTLNIVLLVVVMVLYVRAYLISGMRISPLNKRVFFSAIFLMVAFAVTYIFFPQNRETVNSWLPRIIPYFFITSFMITKMTDTSWITYYMNKYIYVMILVGMFVGYRIYSMGHTSGSQLGQYGATYDLTLSYVLLISVMWLMKKFFEKENIIDALFCVIGIIVILGFGSRNPLLAIVLYLGCNVLRKAFDQSYSRNYKIRYILVLFFCIFLIFSWRDIILCLSSIFEAFSINSRSLRLFAQEEIYLANRDIIINRLLPVLDSHPITGLGIGGDIANIGESAHNMYFGLCVNFGYIVGTGLIVIIIISFFRAFINSNGENREVILLYGCLVFPRGFYGGQIWVSDVFWWLMAFCCIVNSKHSIKK